MSVIGTGRKALHHKVQEPCETNTDSTADPQQRDTLAQQVFNQRALLMRNATVRGISHKLASACLAVIVLFGIVGMAIFLKPCRSTRWAHISDAHGYCWPPSLWRYF
jgi:hypothetical protein